MDFRHVKKITIPNGNVTKITDSKGNILWRNGYSLNLTPVPSSGGTIIANKSQIQYGDYVTLSAIPASDYEFTKWSNNSTVTPLTLGPVSSGITLSAYFSQTIFNLVSNSGDNITTSNSEHIIVRK